MKKVLVLGLGISGQAAVRWLCSQGYEAIGVDKNAELARLHGGLSEDAAIDLSSFAFVVASPGWDPKHPLYAAALAKGIEVIGESELAFQQLQQKAIAITGTNGKTTVTLLCEHVLNSCGIKAKALGNIGIPLFSYLMEPEADTVIIAELSSYQLETMRTPVFEAGVILNITPDHLDRHGSMDAYAEAKCRLGACIKEGGKFYVQDSVASLYGKFLTRPYETIGTKPSRFFWTDKSQGRYKESVEYLLPEVFQELGIHESENVLSAWAVCKNFGLDAKAFSLAVKSFKKPRHRIEFVAKINGISYYDDSKGTNLDAVLHAVDAVPGKVILIAGGVDKGASYKAWEKPFKNKVKKIFVIGQAAEKICRELGSSFKVEMTPSLEAAILKATEAAREEESVLLSPGCASFDMFRDYAHRGEEFQRIVKNFEERKNS